ncbi:MAG: 2OG-Fe(II) oxygenase family protein [Candidatus Paceibacterota bacterium]
MTNIEKPIRELLENGVTYLPQPKDRLNVEGLATAWENFRLLPEETKKRFSVDSETIDPDNGYLVRNGGKRPEGGAFDPDKCFFHYRQKVLSPPVLEQIYKSLSDQELRVCKKFLEYCNIFYTEMDLLFFALLDRLSRKIGNKHPIRYSSNTVLRALHYGGATNPNGYTAKPHVDRGFLTFHIRDSHPGLVLEGEDGVQKPYDRNDDNLLVFLGKKAEKFGLRPVPHGVMQSKPNQSRWSFVFFGHIH